MRVNEKKAIESKPLVGRQLDAKLKGSNRSAEASERLSTNLPHNDVMASITKGNHHKVDISYQGLVGLPDSAPIAEKVIDKRKLTLNV